MDDATYRARGLQIGSGSIESACKQVVTSRLKGAGMIWDEAGAEAVVTVRAYLKSDRWDEAMARRPQRHRSDARTGHTAPAACPEPQVPRSTAAPLGEHSTVVPRPIPPPHRRPPIPPEVHAQVRHELATERAHHPWRRWQGTRPSPRESAVPQQGATP